MITVHNHLDNGSVYEFTNYLTPTQALHTLAVYELAWGGSVIDIDESRVVTKTRVLARTDTTTFSGSPEEMRDIVKLSALYQIIRSEHHEALAKGAVKALDHLPEGARGKPLFITILGPKMMGTMALRAALGEVMGVTKPEELELCVTVPVEDLVAVIELHRETGLPLAEVINQTR